MGSFKRKFFVICMDPGYGQCFEMDSMGYKETLDCSLKLNVTVVSKVNCIFMNSIIQFVPSCHAEEAK